MNRSSSAERSDDAINPSAINPSAQRKSLHPAGQRPSRVLLIGKRFWPHGSTDSAAYLLQLACGLDRQGVHVEVLAPQYASAWPNEMTLREIKVHRPVAVARTDWSSRRYVRSMTSWIQEHGRAFDVIVSNSARAESNIAVDGARAIGAAAVVRVAGHGTHSDIPWWTTSRAARRCIGFAQQADQVVVSGALQQRQLISQGFAGSTIRRIDHGFSGSFVRSQANRTGARRALAAINADLHAPPDEPVAICVTPMERGELDVFVESAMHIVNRFPKIHLWFIGDGGHRDWIYHRLRGDGVRASIAMPGSFADLHDVMVAADLFVQTSDAGLQHHLPAAIGAELPVVVHDSPHTRELLSFRDNQEPSAEADNRVHWYNAAKPKSFRVAVRAVLDDLDLNLTRASDLRRVLVRSRPVTQTIASYVELIEQLSRTKRSTSSDNSFGAVS